MANLRASVSVIIGLIFVGSYALNACYESQSNTFLGKLNELKDAGCNCSYKDCIKDNIDQMAKLFKKYSNSKGTDEQIARLEQISKQWMLCAVEKGATGEDLQKIDDALQ